MKTKKIVADSMPLALKMVRQQLGDNAIIVNTRAVKIGGILGLFGKQKYEVTAYSVESEEERLKSNPNINRNENPKTNLSFKTSSEGTSGEDELKSSVFHKKPQQLYSYYSQAASEPEKAPAPAAQPSLVEKDSLMDELKNMRKLMMNYMINDKQQGALPPGLTKCIERLKKQGVEEEVLEFVVTGMLYKFESLSELQDAEIKQEVFSIIKGLIQKRIPESTLVDERTRMINVIGPTGVGKTTSIAKLATEQVLKQKRRVAMITTDVYRIAAVEQLKTYAGILNVPIEVARTVNELESALKKLEHCDLIYMDTTGRNYKELKYRESINEYLNQPLISDNYLVLSLTTKYEDMQLLLNEFLNSPVKKLILTKFDETSSYGSILNIAYKFPYKIAYITNGQSVPEDITTINADQIASYLLGEEK